MQQVPFEKFDSMASELAAAWEHIGKDTSINKDHDAGHEGYMSQALRSYLIRTAAMEVLNRYYTPIRA